MKDENNNGQRTTTQQSQILAHLSPASNGENISDPEMKPEPMTGLKLAAGIVTPKIEPLPYYPGPIAVAPHGHIIKEIKPAVSSHNFDFSNVSDNFTVLHASNMFQIFEMIKPRDPFQFEYF